MSTVTRLDQTFADLKAQGRKALIPFITAGDPYPEKSVELMLAMAEAGADVIELGVPFSDPMADGPVIQKAAERALTKGISLTHVLADVKAFRARNATTPVVLMGYANPIEEECETFAAQMKAADLAPIFLLAPTSTEERMAAVGRIAAGYVYYVSLKGVTGAGHLDTAAVADMVPRIKAHVNVPVGVGFGIRDAETAKAVAAVSDAVVIGSRIVQLLETQTPETVVAAGRDFIAEIRAALDSLKGA